MTTLGHFSRDAKRMLWVEAGPASVGSGLHLHFVGEPFGDSSVGC